MSCDCCCKKILNLCKTTVCNDSEIDFGIVAQAAGVHKLILDFLGVDIVIEKTFALDDPIKFPTKGLNENYIYTAKIEDPEGKQIIIEKDAEQYDCFSFQTTIAYTLPQT